MKIKTSELTGTNPDWAVAKCEGAKEGWCDNAPFLDSGYPCINVDRCAENYQPSTNWSLAGPIIEREDISFRKYHNAKSKSHGMYYARICRESGTLVGWYKTTGCQQTGPTPLVAAMRCYVGSKLGDEIDVPEELI